MQFQIHFQADHKYWELKIVGGILIIGWWIGTVRNRQGSFTITIIISCNN